VFPRWWNAATAEIGCYAIGSARNADSIAENKYLSRKSWLESATLRREKMSDDLFEKMKKLIADRLEIEESKITLDSSFRQDLGADSLDTYELVYAIEEELGITIPDEKANEFNTVRDALDFIKSELDKK
jgi:acyl carrier protein